MKMYKFSCLCIFLGLASVTLAQVPSNDPNWYLQYHDEFNSLNTTMWNVKDNWDNTGLDANGNFNLAKSEVHVFRKNNVWIDQLGYLVLRTQRETYTCPPFWVGEYFCKRQHYTGLTYEFTAGMVESKPAFDFKYGYIEARVKAPHARGLWPSFWTFRGDGVPESENASEIDIFELPGNRPSTEVQTNLHMNYCDQSVPTTPCPGNPDEKFCPGVSCFGQAIKINDYNNTWLVWGLEWTPSKITWYLNGEAIRQSPNPGITAPVKIYLGMGVTQWALPFPETPFSYVMYVDYIRFYKPYMDCNHVINACNYSLDAHNHKVNKSVSIGGAGCSNSVSVGKNVSIKATDYVNIQGDFTVPVGAGFSASVDGCY